MTAARQFRPHYTVDDYLQWQGDWELWFGTAVAMAPLPFGPHERVVSELAFRLQSSIKSQACDCCLYTGLDWIVQQDTVVRPDIMIVCGPQPEGHLGRSPNLAVEVLSPATADKDWGPKRDLYQLQSVDHYLICDPDTNRLSWFLLRDGQYEEQTFDSQLQLQLRDDCVLELIWS